MIRLAAGWSSARLILSADTRRLSASVLREKSLHAALKNWYAGTDESREVAVDGYVIDLIKNDTLIELQTGNFSAVKEKLGQLLSRHKVRLVHPVAENKWIVKLGETSETAGSRRKSPKKGRVEDVFSELVYVSEYLGSPSLSVEVLLVDVEEIWARNTGGSWRRKGWGIHDQRLLRVNSSSLFRSPDDYRRLVPEDVAHGFTVKELAKATGLPHRTAGKMAYCLEKAQLLRRSGRKGRAIWYDFLPSPESPHE